MLRRDFDLRSDKWAVDCIKVCIVSNIDKNKAEATVRAKANLHWVILRLCAKFTSQIGLLLHHSIVSVYFFSLTSCVGRGLACATTNVDGTAFSECVVCRSSLIPWHVIIVVVRRRKEIPFLICYNLPVRAPAFEEEKVMLEDV